MSVDAPVVAFVHGLAASMEVWAAAARSISDRFGVLRYDLRGHGESDGIDAPCGRSDLAGDLIALLGRHGERLQRSHRRIVPEGRTFAHVAMAMCSLNPDPLTERLRAIRVPALVIVGEKDFLGVGGSVIVSRAIAASELEIRPRRGHGVYLEEPEWFGERLASFVTSRVAVPSGCVS